jgi:hypothetical protein
MIGTVRWFDNSTSTAYSGLCVLPPSSSTLSMYYDEDSGSNAILGSFNSSALNNPFTIASGDFVEWTIVYEAA